MPLADLPDHVDVPPRRDLQLDPAIAFVEVSVDLVEQGFDRRLDPQADARDDLGPRAAEHRMQRHPRARASTSQQAISRPALAKRFPFTGR